MDNIHQYETCCSTGPQYLNPDPEPMFTIGEIAQDVLPESGAVLSAQALQQFAFGLGMIGYYDLDYSLGQ